MMLAAADARADEPDEPDEPTPERPLVFVGDPHFQMEGGIRSLTSAGRLLFHYEDELPALVPNAPRLVATAGRLAKFLFVDQPLTELEVTAIHEIYGHGARARDLGGTATYAFEIPGIYCWILAPSDDTCSSFTIPAHIESGARDKDLLVFQGGIEANLMTAYWLDEEMVARRGYVHHAESLVYLQSKLTYLGSFLSSDLRTAGKLSAGDDVDQYVSLLQDRYNRFRPEDRVDIVRRLRTAYIWNFADPMLAFSAYGMLASIVRGDTTLRFPLPMIGKTSFYAAPRFNVSPFGAEHYLDVFVGRDAWVTNAYARVSTSMLARDVGGGIRTFEFPLTERVALGAELDVWRQTETLFDVRNAYSRTEVWGTNVGATADVALTRAFGLVGRLAYKTRGYLAAQPIDSGVHGYLGVSLTLDRAR
jgi:hypothetical protein